MVVMTITVVVVTAIFIKGDRRTIHRRIVGFIFSVYGKPIHGKANNGGVGMAFIILDIVEVNSISSKAMPIGMIMQSHSTSNMDAGGGNLGINWSEN